MLRLTWVQPEDLLGHELRQARLDGREPAAIEARRRTADGPDAPERAGACASRADGDFGGSVCRAVSGGWDTDSGGATAGSIAGLLAGTPDALPDHWRAPLKNRLATTVADFDGTGFDTLAHLTRLEATRP
ncbi:hypothetical protein GCM10018980_41600 [Streptomyces capoamus]|uniref:ADP-ribosylglycohydrolase n=1 Tax=Streptomyces capoamus TaxID=68183 RepID=A0A919EXH7_9ACTN|nr:hypothetical protein GCM10010501_50070 [Streptomyces libani subsp. rufus]GHG56001.1 hypothetical protein GCM10018980_41600 [Streptomyces capoamus]